MNVNSLKPFVDERYLSEEEALKLLESIPIPDDFVVLKNLRCVDADRNVFEQYPELHIAKDVVRQDGGKQHQFFRPYQAIVHFEQQGLFLPSLALSCNIVAGLFQAAVKKKRTGYVVKDAEFKTVLDQYKDHGAGYGGQAQNTLVDWNGRKITHYPRDRNFPEYGGNNNINQNQPVVELPIPVGLTEIINKSPLSDALQNAEVTKYIRNLTGLENPAVLVEVGKYFGRIANIYASSGSETLMFGFGCGFEDFPIGTSGSLNCASAARGVCLNAPPKNGGAP